MSLFSLEELKGKAPEKSGAFPVSGGLSAKELASLDQVEASILKLEQGQAFHFWSDGRWSMHELLELMLKKTGPAQVSFTTWTITEDPVRMVAMLKEQGLITHLQCLLDYRIRDRKPGPFQLLEAIADRIALTQCHAKVTIVKGEELAITCLSSANFSKNPRIEAGIICEGQGIADFHNQWITKKLDEHGDE